MICPRRRIEWGAVKRYPCVLQEDASTCGVACLATVSRRFGEHPSWIKLRDAAGNLRDGVNLFGLSVAAQRMGFMSRPVSAPPEALSHLPSPFIAHVLREGNGHFVVVHEVKGDRMSVADPAVGLVELKRSEFEEKWSGHALLLAREHALPPAFEAPGLFRRLVALVLPHRRLLVESFFAAILTSALSYGTALLFSNLIDQVFPSGETWTLHLFGGLAVAIAALVGIFTILNQLLITTIGQRVSVHLLFPTLRLLLRLPMAYYEGRRLGDILHRFGTLMGLKGLITRGPVTLALDGMILVMTSAVLLLYDWRLAGILMGILPFMLLVTLIARGPIRKLHSEALQSGGRLQAGIFSMLSGLSTVKSFGAEDLMDERSEPWMGRVVRLNARLEVLATIPRIINRILAGAAVAGIYWVGGLQVMRGELSLGQLIFCVTLAGAIFPPFLSLLEMILSVQEALATLERATDIVDAEPEPPSTRTSTPGDVRRGEVRLEDVSFRYGHEEDTLQGVTVTAQPGEAVAFVGPSGSGKTTLLKLIPRFHVAQSGRILVDGVDVRDWDLKPLRSAMAMVDQDCRTFAGSILENLRIAGEDIPIERFYDAIRLVGLGGFIERLPGRYETDVGEAGTRLSGGERQRLSLARAIARRPGILILDEATAHLDPRMEREIFSRIREQLTGCTVLLATHRMALARQADRVVVLERGRIVEEGAPEGLLEAGGLFARLCGRRRPSDSTSG